MNGRHEATQETAHQDRPSTAIALRYDTAREAAPRVVAKGDGFVAEEILRIARANHVPLREDPALVEALSVFDLNDQIPPELYRAVAEVLAFVYRLENKKV
jgi:flagellar biosynthesis protein